MPPGPMTSWSSYCTHEASHPQTWDGMGVCPTAASCAHLASTCNRRGLVEGSLEGPLEHLPLLVLFSEQGSSETQRPGLHRQASPLGHALSRMCSACQPQARPAAILGVPLGPWTRPASWGLEEAPRGHPAKVEGRIPPWAFRQCWHQAPGRQHVNTCTRAGPGRVRG